MATLNTLRTRGGIIVTIVIGLALIAFLLGDLFSGGTGWMQARKMKVGEINGTSIGYMEFLGLSDRMTHITQMLMGTESLTTEQQDQARDMAWDALIMQHSYRPGFDAMGLTVADEEQEDMATGAFISPVLAQMFANPNTGMFDVAFLNNFISQIDADQSGRSAMLWDYIKNQMVDQRVMSKFIDLVFRGKYINDLEVARGVELANHMFGADVISQSYTTIPDSLAVVSSSEIRAFYNAHQNMFRQNASREIQYVVFNLEPSQQDYADARTAVDNLAEEFAAAENPMQFATLNSHENPDERYLRESELEPGIAAIAFGAAAERNKMYGPVMNGDVFTMARVASVRNLPDSIGLSMIVLPSTQMQRADSLNTILKTRKNDFERLAREYSADPETGMRGGDMGMFAFEQLPAEFSQPAVEGNPGDIFTVETQYGIHIVKLNRKTRLEPRAQIARVTYTVEPSPFTQQTVYGEASAFLTAASGSADKFNAAVSEFGLSPRVADIRNTDRNISGLDNSRELVRWAFTSNKGAVSTIMDAGGNYVIALLTAVNQEGVAPLENVASSIRSRLRQEKKGEMIAAKMQGASLEEIAQTLDTEIIPVTGLQFESFYAQGVGVEPRLIGAICGGAPENTLSRPVNGNSGVFKFVVNQIEKLDNATPESERVRLEAVAQSYLYERMNQALREESNIVDTRVKFF